MRILNRRKLECPISVCSGDKMNLSYTDLLGVTTQVLSAPIERTATYDEAVIFEDEFEGRMALGGMFIEQANCAWSKGTK